MSDNEVTYILENLKQENKCLFSKLVFANNCLKFSIEFLLFVELLLTRTKIFVPSFIITSY